jgi:hypothetical protein
MANYFLASVGNADAFRMVNGTLTHVLSARTLTESTISVSSTMEDVRAGQGAKLYGRFNHDTGMTISLTDAMFKLEYIALQVGSQINEAGGACMHTEKVTAATGGAITPSKTPVAMGKSCGLNHIALWARPVGCDATEDYIFIEKSQAGTFTSNQITAGKEYMITYFVNESGARELLINANFVPAEMILFLTAKLFAGDASAPETGKPVGEITVKIPRFQLDGTFDLSMAMSSAATMSLNGTALAADTANDESVYAEIVEFIEGRKWYANLVDIVYSDDDNELYAIFSNGSTAVIEGDEADVNIAPSTWAGDAAKVTSVSVGGKVYLTKTAS